MEVNTLQSSEKTSDDWSVEIHVAVNDKNRSPLRVDQLAGRLALADGSIGSDSGRFALFNSGNTTGGEWLTVSTGAKGKDPRLPEDVDSLTVWVCLKGGEAGFSFGIGGLRLEEMF